MLSKIVYTAAATTTGGRLGQTRSSDGLLDMKLDKPVTMGGKGLGTNPEQLFAAGYSACFGGTIDFLSQQRKKPLSNIEVKAEVDFGPRTDGGFGIGVRLFVRLPELDRQEAESIVAEAHRNCPYSNATRGNIDVVVTIIE
jgi:osmotically inducible protein OsmC